MTPPFGPPASVPTLTEVLDLGGAEPERPDATQDAAAAAPVAPPSVAARDLDAEAALVERVLEKLQVQIDRMLEVRLRETLAPALTRTADALVRDARRELVPVLRDAVARAVQDAKRDAGGPR